MPDYSNIEQEITNLFEVENTFTFNNSGYIIIKSGKPRPSSGECKTDTYIEAQNIKTGDLKEFKISIKKANADFLENKINLDRAKQILGQDAQSIIKKSITTIKKEFEDDKLICFDKYKRTEAKTIKIGWKFELLNKKGGSKSSELKLTKDQVLDVYSGNNMNDNKKDSKVNKEVIINSGVANYILVVKEGMTYENCQEVIDNIISIEKYIVDKKIYFACKAINYRAEKDKWDGNRPLAVYVNWQLNNKKLTGELVYNAPLDNTADDIGQNIQTILTQLSVNHNNFDDLRSYISSINCHP